MKNRITVFLNAYTQGVSGGDIRFIEIAKRAFPADTLVVTSLLGQKLCEVNGLNARYYITTRELKFEHVILTYIKRLLGACRLVISGSCKSIVLYSTSDFFPDVIPAFIMKLSNKNNLWVQVVHHLIPNPVSRGGGFVRNFVSFTTQKMSLLLIKYKADKVIAIGPLLVRKLESCGFDKAKLFMGYNGVNLKEIENTRVENNIKKYDAVFVGRLHPSKGLEDLIEIWKVLKSQNKKYTLVIMGEGEEQFTNLLENKIKQHGLENNVFMTGYVKNSWPYLKTAKVFVFPSYEEGWGISICEALACGMAVIAYDLPAYARIYNDGIVKVRKGDTVMFCKEVTKCIEDEAYRNEFAKKGSALCQKYDWNNVAENESEIIGDL